MMANNKFVPVFFMKSTLINMLGTALLCIKSVLLVFFALFFCVITAYAADGTYTVYWGTDNGTSLQSPPTNGTGGTVSGTPTFTRSLPNDYTGANTFTFNVTPATTGNGYYVKEIRGRRTQSDGGWNNWYVLNSSSDVTMIVKNASNTTITLDSSRYGSGNNNNYRKYQIAVIFAENSAGTTSGTFKIDWGTTGTGGTGGAITSPTKTISRGSTVSYNGAETIVFNIAPNLGYYVSSMRARRTDSSGDWNSWKTLNDGDVSMIVKNDTSTNVTLNTAQYSGSFRNFEIEVTFASNTVYVSWGTNGNANDSLGGTVTSTGRIVANNQNVDPGFTSYATASFTLNTDSGNTVTKVEYKRSDWNNWANVPGWSSGDSTFSFSMDNRNWSVRVTFRTPQALARYITAYYGTTNTSGFNTNPADWVGGNVYRSNSQLGTSALLAYQYNTSNTTRTIRINPDNGYKIVSVKWAEATWSDPANISPVGGAGAFTDEPVLQLAGTSNDVTLPTTQDSQFSLQVAEPKSYVVWVVFAPVGATGGTVGAWYGTNNTTGYDTPQANGSGGTVYKTSGTTQLLPNRDPAGATIGTDGTVTFQARASAGFKVAKIWYGQPDPIATNYVDVSTATVGGTVTFSFTASGGNNYKIWVVFSSATALRTVTGTTDLGSNAACTSPSIIPTPQVVTDGSTASFTLSTSSNCMLDCVNFDSTGCNANGNGTVSGNTYTTPAINGSDKSFTVKFKPVGFNIVSEYDTVNSPSGSGSISPSGTNNYPKGTSQTYTITVNSGYVISHVWVTDTNVGLTTDTDIAPLAGNSYTFQNLQAAGHIKVQFATAPVASGNDYCQIPAFVAGQASLAPNVLIIFDNSGSMGGTMGDAYYNKKTYDCLTAQSTLSTCTTFYGYFDPGKMYRLSSSTYTIDSVTLNLTPTNGLSGNYLNYRNMDKVDIIRKALMGGRIRDRAAATKYLWSNNGKLIEYGPNLPTGIVQQMSGKVRFGMMVFNDPPEGGRLATVPNTNPVRKTVLGAPEADLIAAMESTETDPKTNTPISETLYEAIRYFQAKPSAYNTGVDYGTMDPVQNSCQKHFILLVTDGEPNSNNNLPGLGTYPTKNGYTDPVFNVTDWENRIPANDRAINNNSTCLEKTVNGVVTNTNVYNCPAGTTNNCATNSEKVEAVAYYMHSADQRTDKEGTQNITLFTVYAFGDGTGTKTLHMAAKYGGYNNKNGNLPSPNTWSSPDDQSEWNSASNCIPDNYFEADNGTVLESNIQTAMSNILAKVASGTAASILSNSEGSGANLLQAVFYPNKIFPGPTTSYAATEANWIGELQNLWYYVDPFITNSTVREDSDYSTTTPDHLLNLKNDYIARFYFLNGETKVELTQDTNGDGVGETSISAALDPDDVKSLWRAGRKLWSRDEATRTIHTSLDGYSLFSTLTANKGGFYTALTSSSTAAQTAADTRAAALQPYLQAANNDSNAEAVKIINYIRGTDQTGYRNRSVTLAVDGVIDTREWKLGDIVSSTPKLQSTNKLNTYNMPTPAGYNDKSYDKFINSANYNKRGMVYVGANDGMLHAFKLGILTVTDGADTGVTSGGSAIKIGGFIKASLTGVNLGEEQWAYIPRSTLPYLKYFTDAVNYKHLFYIDGPTVLSDISIGKSGSCNSDYSLCQKDESAGTNWRSVLIGSMGLGGASKLSVNGVKTPIFDPADATKTRGLGYSSYFALDITDQYYNATSGALENQPVLKWEFPPGDAPDNFGLGYATSGAAIIRIAAKLPADANDVIRADTTKNGKWFAVFASGPTGPIDTALHRFMGRSDQNLKLFVVDLGATIDATHPFVLNTNYWVIDTGIAEAFGGSVVGGAIDTDRWSSDLDGNYQDDALYVGYTKKRTDGGEVSWTDGGVGRLLTKESTNPSEWVFSKVIDGIGPVTTGISRLQDRKNKKLWLYFGTGRFFYTGDDTLSDAYKQRYLMGIQEPCYSTANKIEPACSATALTLGSLKDQTTNISSVLEDALGWYVALDAKSDADSLGAERSITDPVALTNGAVFFTTFKPTTDVCKYGGYSYVWGFNYATGGAASSAALTGKALVQVSTGAFEEISLNTALTASSGRKMGTAMIGKPPADAPPIISNASNKPPKKILHIQEK